MEIRFSPGRIEFEKELNALDRFVLSFISFLQERGAAYVIVSGYVPILFGRSRGTEDIDMYVEKLGKEQFSGLWDALHRQGYWCVNEDSPDEAYSMLLQKTAIRLAEKGRVIPNIEMKFPAKPLDFSCLHHPLTAIMNGQKILISPIEIQIPYKVWLESDKDIEDAVYLYEMFKGRLDKALLARTAEELKVGKKMGEYGIE